MTLFHTALNCGCSTSSIGLILSCSKLDEATINAAAGANIAATTAAMAATGRGTAAGAKPLRSAASTGHMGLHTGHHHHHRTSTTGATADEEDEAVASAMAESGVSVRRRRVEVVSGTVRGEVAAPGFADLVGKFETNFDLYLGQFMTRLWNDSVTLQCHAHLSNLCTRLDYNGFFNKKFKSR
jgi:hypothetical protein